MKKPMAGVSRACVSAEVATRRSADGKAGTDFKENESRADKTLLSFTLDLPASSGYRGLPWQPVRLLVVGCGGVDATVAEARGVLDIPRSDIGWSRSVAIALCGTAYLFAATCTYFVRRRQRADAPGGTGDQPRTGTNYASWWRHLG